MVISLGVGVALTPLEGQILQETELSERLDSLMKIAIERGEGDSAQICSILEALSETGMETRALAEKVWTVSTSFMKNGQYHIAKSIANWALQEIPYRKYPKLLVDLLLFQTDIYLNTGELEEVDLAIKQAKKVVERHSNLDSLLPKIAIVEANLVLEKGLYYEALRIGSEIEGSHLSNEMAPEDWVAFNMLMGNIFRELGDAARSLEYFKEGYTLAGETDTKNFMLGQFENNLAIVYSKLDSFDQAEFFHKKNLQACKESGSDINQAMAYMNLGTLSSKRENFAQALLYFDSSITICQEFQIPIGIAIGNMNRVKSFMKLGFIKKAASALENARTVLDQIDAPSLENNYRILSSWVNSELGNYKQAYTVLKEAYDDREEEREAEVEALVSSWENQLKVFQAEQKSLEIENALQRQTSRMNLLIAMGVILVFVILTGILYILRIRQKNDLMAKLVDQEKANNQLELELKNRELASKSLDIQKALGLREIMVKRLKQIEGEDVEVLKEQIKELSNDIQNTLPEALWEDFKQRFENVERDFIPKLLAVCPELSPIELKTATFLRLNLTSKEIASLTNRAQGTVNNNRSSLRKKLNIDNDENLMVFLLGL